MLKTSLNDLEVGDKISYFSQYSDINTKITFRTVSKITKTTITDDKGIIWQKSTGLERGVEGSRYRRAHIAVYKPEHDERNVQLDIRRERENRIYKIEKAIRDRHLNDVSVENLDKIIEILFPPVS